MIDESSRRSDYEKEIDNKICLFVLQNKLKNIIVSAVNLTFVMTRDFQKVLTEHMKNVLEMFFLKEIDRKNVKELFDVEKDDLFYNVVT